MNRTLSMEDPLLSLNQEQKQAVLHLEGPLLVLAGAGSGKTRIVTTRIVNAIRQGINPGEILAVTFTNKAAGEMQERVQHLTRSLSLFRLPLICTFHSLGCKILRESATHLGYTPSFIIYDEEDSNKLLKTCLVTLNVSKEASHIKFYRNTISTCKDLLQDPYQVVLEELPPAYRSTFTQVFSLYQQRLKEANAVDFDDLLYLTVKLFRENPDVLAHYQERWKYVLIDEYQDTNKAQYMLARMIVGERRNIFVVGDPDQSIYSWRGANIHNILNFEKDYPGAQVIRLEQNYRSYTNILDAANALIKNNYNRYEKKLWSERGEGHKIPLFVGETDREEAGFVIQEIERLHTLQGISLNDITIFYRTNFQSRIFEDFLLRKRIPYVIVGGISFYQRREIKDVLAFLHMLENDNNVIAFARTINIPKRGIGDMTIEKIHTFSSAEGRTLLEFCSDPSPSIRLSKKQKESLGEYAGLINGLRAFKKTEPLHKTVVETIRRSGYSDFLKLDKETYEDRKENINELVSKAAEWEVLNESSSLSNFLEELTLKSSLDEAAFDGGKVNLMTVHNGKGLEFSTVFLVGMEEDLFPHANSRDNYDAIEEERRLCYVGMTRAKDLLYLTASETRFIWGVHRRMRPSRFLREIPKKYLDRIYG